MIRLCILFFLFSITFGFSQTVQLPEVNVSGNREFYSSTNINNNVSLFSNFPRLTVEQEDNAILIKEHSKSIQSKINKKNAFFSFGYGLYDNLKTDLIFGNALPSIFYLVSFHRYSIDYFYNKKLKIFNSAQNQDNFEINLGSDSKNKKWGWLTSITYHKQVYGLQTNSFFANANEKILQLNNTLTLKQNDDSSLSCSLNYIWSAYEISGILLNERNNYQQVDGMIKYDTQWSENNNALLSLNYNYKTLIDPVKKEFLQVSLLGYDNFLLFNLLNLKLYLDAFLSNSKFYFLPYLNLTTRISETMQLKFFGGIHKSLNLIPRFLKTKDYLSIFSTPLNPTITSSGGIGIDTIFIKSLSFSADLSFKSEQNLPYITQNTTQLYTLHFTTIDSWVLLCKLNLLKTHFANSYISYNYQLFSRSIPYYPAHTIASTMTMKFSYFSTTLNLKYLNSIHRDKNFLHDIFIIDFLFNGKITNNIFWNLNFNNIFNQIYSYYENYKEPGFLMDVGLKINLL